MPDSRVKHALALIAALVLIFAAYAWIHRIMFPHMVSHPEQRKNYEYGRGKGGETLDGFTRSPEEDNPPGAAVEGPVVKWSTAAGYVCIIALPVCCSSLFVGRADHRRIDEKFGGPAA